METQAGKTQELVTVSADVPAAVAEVYRRAATLTGTDLEGLVQDVLLDNLPYMREMIEIVEQLDAGRPGEALATFQRLSDGMQVHAAQELVSLQETLQAQVGVAAERGGGAGGGAAAGTGGAPRGAGTRIAAGLGGDQGRGGRRTLGGAPVVTSCPMYSIRPGPKCRY